MEDVQVVPLHEAARERYLSYAMSVITSRALPDVRDGLKPVQRRILFTMAHELNLQPGGRYRKCAAVVGEVMGKFHPHGDQSIYDALARLAQDFSMRYPLVDGQGNFGSLDGDNPAAMRYTECRLQPLAIELLDEIKRNTVDWRPNYDGQRFEPVMLPAQFPQLLVNGVEGIAVGMATRIPPHNLGEVIDACVAMIDRPGIDVPGLLEHIRGPDFPTGGCLMSGADEIRAAYEAGQGTLKVRSSYFVEKDGRRTSVVVTSVPYGANKATILERIGEHVADKRLPLVIGLRDESTDDVRIVLDLKQGASPEAVMAYLFKHTGLESGFPCNFTVLVPSSNPEVGTPARLDLREIIKQWLNFRFATVRRRFEYDLAQLLKRIHILTGFVIVFDALDEAIALIRRSEGRRDAAERLMDRFDLDEEQTDAILDLQLYKLAKMQIEQIREELEEKRAEADRIERILASSQLLWDEVKGELLEIRRLYADPRRTTVDAVARAVVYDEDAYIVKEDSYVVVTRGGWFKRQSSFSDLARIRVRDHDEIGWLIKAHTRSTLTFFTNLGSAYVMRVDDVPSTTGHGEPVQKHFTFADGERIVGVISHDARHRPDRQEGLPLEVGDDPPGPYAFACTKGGRVLRFPLAAHEELSNKNGRRFAKCKDGDEVLVVWPIHDHLHVGLASRGGRAVSFPLAETPILKAAGTGVTGLSLRDDDEILACELARNALDGPEVVTAQGRELVVRERGFAGPRGGKGKVVLQRGSIDVWRRGPVVQLGAVEEAVTPDEDEDVS